LILGLAFLAIVLSPCVEGFEIRPYDMTHGALNARITQGNSWDFWPLFRIFLLTDLRRIAFAEGS